MKINWRDYIEIQPEHAKDLVLTPTQMIAESTVAHGADAAHMQMLENYFDHLSDDQLKAIKARAEIESPGDKLQVYLSDSCSFLSPKKFMADEMPTLKQGEYFEPAGAKDIPLGVLTISLDRIDGVSYVGEGGIEQNLLIKRTLDHELAHFISFGDIEHVGKAKELHEAFSELTEQAKTKHNLGEAELFTLQEEIDSSLQDIMPMQMGFEKKTIEMYATEAEFLTAMQTIARVGVANALSYAYGENVHVPQEDINALADSYTKYVYQDKKEHMAEEHFAVTLANSQNPDEARRMHYQSIVGTDLHFENLNMIAETHYHSPDKKMEQVEKLIEARMHNDGKIDANERDLIEAAAAMAGMGVSYTDKTGDGHDSITLTSNIPNDMSAFKEVKNLTL